MNAVSTVDLAPVTRRASCVPFEDRHLDDRQGVALRLAGWSSLDADVRRGSKT